MVEDIEDFPTKLNQLVLTDLGSLDKRNIGIVKAWADDYIPAHASKVINSLSVYKRHRQDYGGA